MSKAISTLLVPTTSHHDEHDEETTVGSLLQIQNCKNIFFYKYIRLAWTDSVTFLRDWLTRCHYYTSRHIVSTV